MSLKCPLCDNKYETLQSLVRHWSRGHKQKTDKLFLKLNNLSNSPTCGCGCGKEVKFLDARRGFREFVRGHASRVPSRNNFVTKKAQESSLKTRRKMFAEGELQVWNKGKTKETHPSVAKHGIKGSKTIKSKPRELKKRSDRMRNGRLDGTIPTLRREKHSQWKGGVSPLLSVCHSNKRLFDEWKYPILTKQKFTCQKCGASRNDTPRAEIEVHHNKARMATIVHLIAEQCGWEGHFGLPTKENDREIINLKEKIYEAVVDFHIENKVSGQVLCKDCHKKRTR